MACDTVAGDTHPADGWGVRSVGSWWLCWSTQALSCAARAAWSEAAGVEAAAVAPEAALTLAPRLWVRACCATSRHAAAAVGCTGEATIPPRHQRIS